MKRINRKDLRQTISRDELRSQEIELELISHQLYRKIDRFDPDIDTTPDERFRVYDDEIWIKLSHSRSWLDTAIALWTYQQEIQRLCSLNATGDISNDNLREEIQKVINLCLIA